MTFSPPAPASEAPAAAGPGVVLVAPGRADRVDALQREAAGRLATLLHLELRPIRSDRSPDAVLSDLLAGGDPCPGGPTWLAPLSLDPGFPLGGAGTWAQALGAWRQPTLVLLTQDHLASGTPAAVTALLAQSSVPLLGLIQWGGTWDREARRHDTLPWLGCVDGTDTDADPDGADVRLALVRRWRWLRDD